MKLDDALKKLTEYIKTVEYENTKDINLFDNKTHKIPYEDHFIYLRELNWKEGLQIDANSFRKNGENIYISSESEKREIISKALIKITKNDEDIEFTTSDLSHKFVEDIWLIYQNYLHLSTEEINYIYNSAKKYFDPDKKEIFPVHPMIIEVDYMLQGIVSLSKEEFSNLTIKEFEAMQLIIATKNEI